jgi:hypothetical protein
LNQWDYLRSARGPLSRPPKRRLKPVFAFESCAKHNASKQLMEFIFMFYADAGINKVAKSGVARR